MQRAVAYAVGLVLLSSVWPFAGTASPAEAPGAWPGVRGDMQVYDDARTLQDKLVFTSKQAGWPDPEPCGALEDLTLDASILELYAVIDEATGLVGLDAALAQEVRLATSKVQPEVADPLATIVQGVALAAHCRELAFETVPDDVWTAIAESPELLSGEAELPPEIASALSNIRKEYLLGGMLTLLDAKDIASPRLQAAAANGIWPTGLPVVGPILGPQPDNHGPAPMIYPSTLLPDTSWEELGLHELQAWQDPVGLIYLGTTGTDTHAAAQTRWISIDPAGNDVYNNNAGGANGAVARNVIGFALDFGRGNDRYVTTTSGVQGGAIAGIAYLEDQGGANYFSAGTGSQGSGSGGVGILNMTGQLGEDDDDYTNPALLAQTTQGAGGLAGIGFLIDWGGDDQHFVQRFGLGANPGEGVGIFEDVDGTDRYNANTELAAGYTSPLSPGYARFIDRGGSNDCYRGESCLLLGNAIPWGDNKVWTQGLSIGGLSTGGGVDE